MQARTFRMPLGSSELSVELTPLAVQANGRVMARIGDTMVLVTAVMASHPREGGDFFPLTVDYEEKFYATGKILGSRFVKRESRPTEEAILTARLIDRTIRPRFDLRMRNDVQVVATVLSFDGEHDPDVAALFGASLALSLSDIPWDGPLAGVRIALSGEQWVVHPTLAERAAATLDMLVAGDGTTINMIEAGAKEIPEAMAVAALEEGQRAIQSLIAFAKDIIAAAPAAKITVPLAATAGPLRGALRERFAARMGDALWEREKVRRHAALATLQSEWHAFAQQSFPEATPAELNSLWEDALDVIVHERIIAGGERPDGRRPDELRPLSAVVGLLPRVHGSGLFIRGDTQALSSLTLGGPGDQQIIEGMEIRTKRRFMHHYNFPPYATGEVKFMRGPGRREIGHGALAERALAPLIPPREQFPYTIRIVSEILSSNGSSSMASVSGASLALFDAGVPLRKPAAGIAMGLMQSQPPAASGQQPAYVILTDIQGPEDHYGDMDFKAAGTADGVTAIQMDVKIGGLTIRQLSETLEQARRARLQILEVLSATLPAPRPSLSPHAPRMTILTIDPQKIGALIGPGGKTINGIIDATGATIDVEDDGTVSIMAETADAMARATELIAAITHEYKPGELLEGAVTRIFDFGAMVEVAPRQEGLIHISELAPWRVAQVEDIVAVGDRIPVVVRNVDEQGRLNLSLKSVPGRYSEADRERGEVMRRQYAQEHPRGHGGDRHGSERSHQRSRRPRR